MRPTAPLTTRALILILPLLAFVDPLIPTPAHAEAQRLRLFGPGTATSDILDDARMSPDGEWAVARWDVSSDGVYQLFAVRRDGRERHQLSLPSPFTVVSFAISPDSRWVVFEAELLADGVRELWSVPIAGPAANARMSPAWIAGGGVNVYEISPDSSRVVLSGDFEADGIEELYSAPIAGPTGSTVKLNPPPVLNGEVFEFKVSPDSARVVFAGDTAQVGRLSYWSVPIAGPSASAVQLNGTAPAGASTASSIHISPDSTQVVYTGTLSTSADTEIWRVPIAGPSSSSVKLNPAVVASGDVRTNHLEITPDGGHVVFFGDLRVDERLELWSVPIDGSLANAVRLNPTPLAGGSLNNADPFVISPDGSWLVMHGDLETVGASELWRVPIGGPANAAVKIHPDAVDGGEVGVGDYAISPDSNFVVFSGDLETDGETELWSASRSGAAGAAVKLSATTIAAGDVGRFEIAPDSSRVVFRGDLTIDARLWLFSRAIDGSGTRTLLTDELLFATDADVDDWVVTADSRDVIYEANTNDPTRPELYRRRVADGDDFQNLSGDAPTFTEVRLVGASPEGRGALYRADTSFTQAFVLWIADDWILSANFEEGTFIEWTSSLP